jgi:CBS domain-containing protein
MRVADVMTQEVCCCTTDDTLATAARMMWEHDCGSVPVLEPAAGRAIGMITDRDICMAALMHDRPPSAITVREVMSDQLYACTPEDTVRYAEQLLEGHQVRRLPVLDDTGRVVGILSLADIVRAANNGAGRRREIRPEEITETLGGITRPRAGASAAALH